MKTRIFTLLVAFLAIAGNAVWGQSFTYGGGSGTETDPYKINSKTDLESLATAVNGGESYEGKYFELTQSINLKGDESNQWTPIGNYCSVMGSSQGTPFKGIFDGKGNTVSGLQRTSTGTVWWTRVTCLKRNSLKRSGSSSLRTGPTSLTFLKRQSWNRVLT